MLLVCTRYSCCSLICTTYCMLLFCYINVVAHIKATKAQSHYIATHALLECCRVGHDDTCGGVRLSGTAMTTSGGAHQVQQNAPKTPSNTPLYNLPAHHNLAHKPLTNNIPMMMPNSPRADAKISMTSTLTNSVEFWASDSAALLPTTPTDNLWVLGVCSVVRKYIGYSVVQAVCGYCVLCVILGTLYA